MSRHVPWPGGRLARKVEEEGRSHDGDSDTLLMLCDRTVDGGGGPGGGGGNGMPGSHLL